MANNCDFTSSRSASLAFLRTKGIIDKFLNIKDLPAFRKENSRLSEFAKTTYGIDQRLFFEENEGTKAVPNELAFRQIDEMKKFGKKISFMPAFAIDEDDFVNDYTKPIAVYRRRIGSKKHDLSIVGAKLRNKDLTGAERKDLLLEQSAILKEIEVIEKRIGELKKATDISVFETIVRDEIDEINKLLDKKDITAKELNYILETIDLYNYLADTSELENMGIFNPKSVDESNFKDFIRKVGGETDAIQRRFKELVKDKLVDWGEGLTGKNFTKKQMFSALVDAGTIPANSLNIADFGDNLLELLYIEMKKQEMEANKMVLSKFKRIDDLLKGLSRTQLNLLWQKDSKGRMTGAYVFRYLQDYFTKRGNIWAEYHEKKGAGETTKAYDIYTTKIKPWTKANHVGFDVTKLFIEEDEAYKKELEDELGTDLFELKYNEAKDGWEMYQLALEEFKMTYTDADAIAEFEKEHSPVLHHEALFGKGTGKFNSDFYVYVPKKIWHDKAYEEVQKDEKLKEFYDFMMNTSSNYYKFLPHHIRKQMQINSLPFVEQRISESLVTNPLGFVSTTLDATAKAIRSGEKKGINRNVITGEELPFVQLNLSTLEDAIEPIVESKISQFTADILLIKTYDELVAKYPIMKQFKRESFAVGLRSWRKGNLPAFLISDFEADAKDQVVRRNATQDIGVQLKTYIMEMEAYMHRKRSEDVFKLVRRSMDYREEIVGTSTQKGLSNLKELLDHQTKMAFGMTTDTSADASRTNVNVKTPEEKELKKKYEEDIEKIKASDTITDKDKERMIKLAEEKIKELGKGFTWSKLGDLLLQYVTFNRLGWSITSGIGNMSFGYIANWTEAAGGNNFGEKALSMAYNYVFNRIGKKDEANKAAAIMSQYGFLKTVQEELFKQDKTNNVVGNLKYLSPYYVQQETEYLNQAPPMVAYLLEQPLSKWVEGADPNLKLWDAFDSEGNLKYPINEAVFKATIDQLLAKLHGDYGALTKAMAKASWGGRALMQFRTWMAKAIDQRWSKEQDSLLLGTTKGRWRSYGQLNNVDKVMASLKYLTRKLYIGKLLFNENLEGAFTEVDAYNMRQNMAELAMLIKIIALGVIIRALTIDDDDEEKEDKMYMALLTLNMLARVETDITFYINPVEFERLNQNFLPVTRVITDTAKALDAARDYILEPTDKGRERVWLRTGALFPASSPVVTTYKYVTYDFDSK